LPINLKVITELFNGTYTSFNIRVSKSEDVEKLKKSIMGMDVTEQGTVVGKVIEAKVET